MSDLPVSFADIQAAAVRIAPYVHRTPVLESRRLNEILGGRVAFKCENQQRIGAFKARGAHNAVFSLSDAEAAKGVVTHSSGNHAAALALAASNRGVAAHIVMPRNAPKAKVESVRRLGGQIVFCEPTIAARESACEAIMAETGAVLVHPYDDALVIAGQGTAALELLEERPELDFILAPVGGGGLMSGTSIAARAIKPSIRIVATEPAQANDAWRSWTAKAWTAGDAPNTIADGLRTTLGQRGFVILNALLDDFVTVSEDGIRDAMRLVWEVLKIVIEPSSAVPVAALLERKLDLQGAAAGVILTGGNVDLDRLPWQA
ncbi:pyridoxal-phosphate dependent enzyme [Caulobacter sp. NIBR2454]|uniref:pyridoxal-phosphate dependent enzyme n=1 Tax=Caulobacter sp. NIBR2454 TaxID=3015996 RepID=UPI0022B742F4|nr:pyridoxal-phosphate dependent enzyme [Caulobacter sp. NIBR2454]